MHAVRLISFAAIALCVVFAGCGGGNGGPFIGVPTAKPSATPGIVTLSPASLAFTASGSSYAQTVTVTQSNYSNGAFTAGTTTCSGIATVAEASSTSFTFTPVGAGSCTYTISGGNGQSATLAVGVTTTSVGGH
jgi:hypothetical protein